MTIADARNTSTARGRGHHVLREDLTGRPEVAILPMLKEATDKAK
jgi:hypothetical protein